MCMGEWPEDDEEASELSSSTRFFDLGEDPPTLFIEDSSLQWKFEAVSALPADIAFLESPQISRDFLAKIALIAREKKVAASEILIARGIVSRREYLAHLADATGANLLSSSPPVGSVIIPQGDPTAPPDSDGLFSFPSALHLQAKGRLQLVVGPQNAGATRLLRAIKANPDSSRNVWLAPGSQLRRLWFDGLRDRMALQARTYLVRKFRDYSAARRMTHWQSVTSLFLIFLVGVALYTNLQATVFAMTAFFSMFYFAIISLRVCVIAYLDEVSTFREAVIDRDNIDPEDYPLYSIMVALYREADGISELVASLAAMDWPGSKREIFLICEEDDQETIAAIRKQHLPRGFQLVICPYSLPRTKPKALNFVLPLCAGEFTVIYDAEDRPDPKQLLEAWTKFSRLGKDTACLQAPLLINNDRQNWLTAMFALEYETLFLGMLPILSKLGVPLPLGGTSNHFRTSALKSAGGWDPFNVTEDADLGIRLSRMGYRCGTISRPTWEEAPPDLAIWIRQRTRWLKGWLQTVLVHTRNPIRTGRELGWRANVFFHLVMTSIVVSTLIHPIFLAQAIFYFAQISDMQRPDIYQLGLLGLSMFNLAGGYTTYGFLAYGVMARHKHTRSTPKLLLFLPVYWLLISYAGWRAVKQLFTHPFHWEKTTHGLANHHANANMK